MTDPHGWHRYRSKARILTSFRNFAAKKFFGLVASRFFLFIGQHFLVEYFNYFVTGFLHANHMLRNDKHAF